MVLLSYQSILPLMLIYFRSLVRSVRYNIRFFLLSLGLYPTLLDLMLSFRHFILAYSCISVAHPTNLYSVLYALLAAITSAPMHPPQLLNSSNEVKMFLVESSLALNGKFCMLSV